MLLMASLLSLLNKTLQMIHKRFANYCSITFNTPTRLEFSENRQSEFTFM
jgi:hypothetical protein